VQQTLPEGFAGRFDLGVVMECSSLERCGFPELARIPLLDIDHHKGNTRYGEVCYLDEDAPAAGEMVLRMFRAAGVAPSADAATNMYVALSTDTGDFRYSNATPRAFRAAADLVAAGAWPERVAEWVHERRSAGSVRLLGEALGTLTIDSHGRVATVAVDAGAFERAGATAQDTDGIVDVPRAIAGVQAVLLLKEREPGVVRVSLRSKGAIDVEALAARHGGGGHANAAGCTLGGELASVRQAMTKELIEMVEQAATRAATRTPTRAGLRADAQSQEGEP
jgi:phosphoesterase RecJ-like protein